MPVNPVLPMISSAAAYADLRADGARCEAIVTEMTRALGAGTAARLVDEGSNLVAFVGGDLVIKLFPPFLRHQHQSEQSALAALVGRLSVPTPAIVSSGTTSGWSYLVMTRLEGSSLEAAWTTCNGNEQRELLHRIGQLIAEAQAIPPSALQGLEPGWATFLAGQAERCSERQARFGMPAHLLADLPRYLSSTGDVLPRDFRPVLLTGEYTPGSILVTRRDGAWQVSGLVDFGDAMVGFSEYDLLGPGTFLAAGDPAHLQALLSGCGGANDAGLGRRLMRLLLLHRYSNLPVQVRIEGWQRARDLDALERLLWPLGDS